MDPRFFRQYLDILSEAPVTPPPALTQAQADKLNANLGAATDKMIQGGEKMGAGNYASGAMTAASGANDAANAVGMTTGDKVRAVGMGVKTFLNQWLLRQMHRTLLKHGLKQPQPKLVLMLQWQIDN